MGRGSLQWSLPLQYKLPITSHLSWLGSTLSLTEPQSLYKADLCRSSTIPFKVKPKLAPFASDIWCLVHRHGHTHEDDWMSLSHLQMETYSPGTEEKHFFHILAVELLPVVKPRACLSVVEFSFEFLATCPLCIAQRERERENDCGGWRSPLGVIQSFLKDIVEKHNELLLTHLIDDLGYW